MFYAVVRFYKAGDSVFFDWLVSEHSELTNHQSCRSLSDSESGGG